jgi:hypothetical protein
VCPLLLCLLGEAQASKLVGEARQAPAAIQQLLCAAGPCWMRIWINIKIEGITLLAESGARNVMRTIGHYDLDEVVVGMRILFHRVVLGASRLGGVMSDLVVDGKIPSLVSRKCAGHVRRPFGKGGHAHVRGQS